MPKAKKDSKIELINPEPTGLKEAEIKIPNTEEIIEQMIRLCHMALALNTNVIVRTRLNEVLYRLKLTYDFKEYFTHLENIQKTQDEEIQLA